jgi:hypothetical protein
MKKSKAQLLAELRESRDGHHYYEARYLKVVIAGITGVNTTFIMALAFLKQEQECDLLGKVSHR